MEENKTVVSLEDKVKEINKLDEITLRDTVDLMNSDNYKERFIAEYMQVKIRYNNLHKMLIKSEAGTLEFKPTCSNLILQTQKSSMSQYIKQLEIRAEIEKIPLPHM